MPKKYPGYINTSIRWCGTKPGPTGDNPPSWSTHQLTVADNLEEVIEDFTENEDVDNVDSIYNPPHSQPISVETLVRYKRTQAKRKTAESMSNSTKPSQPSSSRILTPPPPVAQRPQNGRILFTKMMLTRPSSSTPKLSRTTSTNVPSMNDTPPPQPPSFSKSISAPNSISTAPPVIHHSKLTRQTHSLPNNVKEVPLVPSLCLSTTLIHRDARAAVEVAWRRGGYLRVLPIIGVPPALSTKIEEQFSVIVAKQLYKQADQTMVGTGEVSLNELTCAVVSCLPSLETLLGKSLPPVTDGRFSECHNYSWNHSLRNALGVATGCKIEALSLFDRWCASEEEEKQTVDESDHEITSSSVGLGKYRVSESQSVFGSQECVVCGNVCPIPGLNVDGVTGGAALSSCGHWCCTECWHGYLTSASGDGVGCIGCPGYQCKSRALTRGVLAHLVGEGAEGAVLFDKLERFRAEKARFVRRLRLNDALMIAEDVVTTKTVSRYCPDRRCSKLLRGTTVGDSTMMLVCECGGVVCSFCGSEDGHLGLSCGEYASYLKQLAPLEKEALSIAWLEAFTKPCPKCNYSIERNGGCLHMRCQQCQYYFCWECLGPGEKCKSFRCETPKKATAELVMPDINKMRGIYAHRTAMAAASRREWILREKEGGTEQDDGSFMETLSALMSQLLLLKRLIWLRIWAYSSFKMDSQLTSSSKQSQSASGAIGEASKSIDQLLHAISERNHMLLQNKRSNVPTTRQEQTMKEKELRRIKAQAKVNDRNQLMGLSSHHDSRLNELMEDDELKSLLVMSPIELKKRILQTMRSAVKVLVNVSPAAQWKVTTNKCKRGISKRGSSRPAEDLVRRKQMLSGHHLPGGTGRRHGIGIAPWQKNRTLSEMPESQLGGPTRIRWKGREKAKAHRERAMKAEDWEVGGYEE